jgi:hypothetical protein
MGPCQRVKVLYGELIAWLVLKPLSPVKYSLFIGCQYGTGSRSSVVFITYYCTYRLCVILTELMRGMGQKGEPNWFTRAIIAATK